MLAGTKNWASAGFTPPVGIGPQNRHLPGGVANEIEATRMLKYNIYMAHKHVEISAASAAAALARRLVAQGRMTSDEGILFSNWVDRSVKLGTLPDDPKMLGLIESEWKTASSFGNVHVGRVVSVGRFGISTDIVRPSRVRRRQP